MFKIGNSPNLSCSGQRPLGLEHWDFGLPREMLALWNSALRTSYGGFHRAGLFHWDHWNLFRPALARRDWNMLLAP